MPDNLSADDLMNHIDRYVLNRVNLLLIRSNVLHASTYGLQQAESNLDRARYTLLMRLDKLLKSCHT